MLSPLHRFAPDIKAGNPFSAILHYGDNMREHGDTNHREAAFGGADTPGLPALASEQPALLDANAVAQMLHCSHRTVYRLADSGRIPPPVKLGTLSRWPRQALEQWIADGCLPCDRPRKRR